MSDNSQDSFKDFGSDIDMAVDVGVLGDFPFENDDEDDDNELKFINERDIIGSRPQSGYKNRSTQNENKDETIEENPSDLDSIDRKLLDDNDEPMEFDKIDNQEEYIIEKEESNSEKNSYGEECKSLENDHEINKEKFEEDNVQDDTEDSSKNDSYNYEQLFDDSNFGVLPDGNGPNIEIKGDEDRSEANDTSYIVKQFEALEAEQNQADTSHLTLKLLMSADPYASAAEQPNFPDEFEEENKSEENNSIDLLPTKPEKEEAGEMHDDVKQENKKNNCQEESFDNIFDEKQKQISGIVNSGFTDVNSAINEYDNDGNNIENQHNGVDEILMQEIAEDSIRDERDFKCKTEDQNENQKEQEIQGQEFNNDAHDILVQKRELHNMISESESDILEVDKSEQSTNEKDEEHPVLLNEGDIEVEFEQLETLDNGSYENEENISNGKVSDELLNVDIDKENDNVEMNNENEIDQKDIEPETELIQALPIHQDITEEINEESLNDNEDQNCGTELMSCEEMQQSLNEIEDIPFDSAEIERLKKVIQEHEDTIEALKNENTIEENARATIMDGYRKRIEELEGKVIEMQENLDVYKDKIIEVTNQIEEKNSKIASMEEQINEDNIQVQLLKVSVESYKSDYNKLKKTNEEMNLKHMAETEAIIRQNEKQVNDLNEFLKKTSNEAEEKIKILEKEKIEIENLKDQYKEHIDSLAIEYEKVVNQEEQNKVEIIKLNKNNDCLNEIVKEQEITITELTESNKEYQMHKQLSDNIFNDNENNKKKIKDLTNKISEIMMENEKMKEEQKGIIEEYELRIKQVNEEYNRIINEKDKIIKQNEKISEEYGTILTENKALNSALNLNQKKFEEEQETAVALKQENDNLVQLNKQIKRNNEELASNYQALEINLVDQKTLHKEDVTRLSEMISKIKSDNENEIIEFKNEIRLLKSSEQDLKKKLLESSDVTQSLNTEIEKLTAIIQEERQQKAVAIAEKEEYIKQYGNASQTHDRLIDGFRVQSFRMQESITQLTKEMNEAKRNNDDLKLQMKKLHEFIQAKDKIIKEQTIRFTEELNAVKIDKEEIMRGYELECTKNTKHSEKQRKLIDLLNKMQAHITRLKEESESKIRQLTFEIQTKDTEIRTLNSLVETLKKRNREVAFQKNTELKDSLGYYSRRIDPTLTLNNDNYDMHIPSVNAQFTTAYRRPSSNTSYSNRYIFNKDSM